MTPDATDPWQLMTDNGVFSSPVIDGEGHIYLGSGDHTFYALSPEGKKLWRFAASFFAGSIPGIPALTQAMIILPLAAIPMGGVFTASCAKPAGPSVRSS